MAYRLGPFLADLAAIEAQGLRSHERDARINALIERLVNEGSFPELNSSPALRARIIEDVSNRFWAAASTGQDTFARAAIALRAIARPPTAAE